jgi:hypothetical protein
MLVKKSAVAELFEKIYMSNIPPCFSQVLKKYFCRHKKSYDDFQPERYPVGMKTAAWHQAVIASKSGQ